MPAGVRGVAAGRTMGRRTSTCAWPGAGAVAADQSTAVASSRTMSCGAAVRTCQAPSCGFFFFGRPDQEWCSIPCGNRARAARHYARRRANR